MNSPPVPCDTEIEQKVIEQGGGGIGIRSGVEQGRAGGKVGILECEIVKSAFINSFTCHPCLRYRYVEVFVISRRLLFSITLLCK